MYNIGSCISLQVCLKTVTHFHVSDAVRNGPIRVQHRFMHASAYKFVLRLLHSFYTGECLQDAYIRLNLLNDVRHLIAKLTHDVIIL